MLLLISSLHLHHLDRSACIGRITLLATAPLGRLWRREQVAARPETALNVVAPRSFAPPTCALCRAAFTLAQLDEDALLAAKLAADFPLLTARRLRSSSEELRAQRKELQRLPDHWPMLHPSRISAGARRERRAGDLAASHGAVFGWVVQHIPAEYRWNLYTALAVIFILSQYTLLRLLVATWQVSTML